MLRVCLFNMLENGLAFGAIPWVMIIPAAMQAESSNFDNLQVKLKNEYINHWHKNVHVGPDYKSFRRMWGRHIKGPDDLLAPGLHSGGINGEESLRFAGEDEVEYDRPDGSECAVTLRGMLMREVRSRDGDHTALAARMFDHIASMDEQVFDWRLRGKAIFELVTNRLAGSGYQGAGSSAARFHAPAGLSPSDPVDLIVLCEYDVHVSNDEDCPKLDYLGDGVLRSFPEAMVSAGFHVILFEGPKADNCGPALFARAAVFDLPSQSQQQPTDAQQQQQQQQQQRAVEEEEEEERAPLVRKAAVSHPHPSLASFDLQEMHHPAKGTAPFSIDATQMRLADRRSAGFVALDIKGQPGRRLVVCISDICKG
jgi:hypothetical protein